MRYLFPLCTYILLANLFLPIDFSHGGNATEVDTYPSNGNAPNNPKTSGSSKPSSSQKNSGAVIRGALEILSNPDIYGPSREDREAAYKQLQEDAERNAKRENERLQGQNRVKKAMQDPSLNPWGRLGNGPDKDPSTLSGETPDKDAFSDPKKTKQAAQQTALEPSANYDGQPCRYFTQVSDEAHLRYHGNGSFVAYGGRVYECKEGRWGYRTTTKRYWGGDKAAAAMEANKLEKSKFNTQVYEKE